MGLVCCQGYANHHGQDSESSSRCQQHAKLARESM
jgi:hypothetical protein